MRASELLRLVWLNISQNKFKTIMTSIGIIVGAATIVMVMAIGRGGQMDVAEQFSSLNAGAIDISYDSEAEDQASGFSFGSIGDAFMSGMSQMFGGAFGGGGNAGGGSMTGDGMSFSANGSSGGGSSDGGGMTGGGMSFSANGSSGGGGSDGGGMIGGGMDFAANGSSGSGNADGGSMPGGSQGFSSDGNAGGGNADNGSMPGGGQDFSADGSTGTRGGRGSSADGSADGGTGTKGGHDFSTDGTAGAEGGSAPGGAADENAGAAGADGGEKSGSASDSANDDGENTENETGTEEVSEKAAEEEAETEESLVADRINQESIIFTMDDVEDIECYVPGIDGVTISYSTKASVEGGSLSDSQTYTIAGVKNSYESISRLEMASGMFLTDEDDDAKARVCVLGSSVAKELYQSADDAYESSLYIDDRAYTVIGVLESTGTVSAGITPDDTIFIPYQTGIKYITGESIQPTITVLSSDVNAVDEVISNVELVLGETYANAEFTFEDAGSKMEAAESSNQILTMLLWAMAAIVFLVGGIGIMNVLFVSVKERTNEIGILKALGASRRMILFEFLLESAAISLIGGVLGVGASFAITPLVEYYGIRVEANSSAWFAALGFALLTGTLFGIYPAWKASRLVPVDALNAE